MQSLHRLAPGSTDRLVALGLVTTTAATDKVSAVLTCGECSLPIASIRTTSKLAHEDSKNDRHTSVNDSEPTEGPVSETSEHMSDTPGQHAPENVAKPGDVFVGEPLDHTVGKKTEEPGVNYQRDVNQVPVESASDIDEEFQVLAKVVIDTEYEVITKEDNTGDVLQILFDSNSPQQPPNNQPDGPHCPDHFMIKQKKDPDIRDIFKYVEWQITS